MRRHATRNLEQIEDIMPFTPAALTFFRGLAKNNKKEWFEASFAETVPRRYLEELGAAPWDGEGTTAVAPSSQG